MAEGADGQVRSSGSAPAVSRADAADVRELTLQIAHTRDRMAATIDAIHGRLDPSPIVNQATEVARRLAFRRTRAALGTAVGTTRIVIDTARAVRAAWAETPSMRSARSRDVVATAGVDLDAPSRGRRPALIAIGLATLAGAMTVRFRRERRTASPTVRQLGSQGT